MAKVNFDIEEMSAAKVAMYEEKLFSGKAKRVRYPMAECKRAYATIRLVALTDEQAQVLAHSRVPRMHLSAAVHMHPNIRCIAMGDVFYTRLDHDTWSIVGDISNVKCAFNGEAQDCSIPA